MFDKGDIIMNENNQNLAGVSQTEVVNQLPKQKKNATYWLVPVALLLSGGVFKGISLIVDMVNAQGGEIKETASVIVNIIDILPLIAWGLIIPSIIVAIIMSAKQKKIN